MTALMVTMRIIHIFSAIFWVGSALFFVFFFQPILKVAGAAGGAIMGKLSLSQFPTVVAVSSSSTVLAGLVMFTIDSNYFQAAWFTQPKAIILTTGAVSGIIAAGIGLFIQRPALLRITALQKEMQAAGGSPTPAQLQELGMLQAKFTRASRLGVVFMIIADIGMSAAREFGNI